MFSGLTPCKVTLEALLNQQRAKNSLISLIIYEKINTKIY